MNCTTNNISSSTVCGEANPQSLVHRWAITRQRPVSSHTLLGLLSLCLGHAAMLQAEIPIPINYQRVAQEYAIPPTVLYAIALVESGQKRGSGPLRPWPWTLNVAGVPRRYPTRLAAWHSLIHYLRQGLDLIDIGIMQVNWRYHQQQLGTAWQALDPFHNIRTGARILRTEYQKTRVWPNAIGRYHSPGRTPAQQRRARHYARKVSQNMDRIHNRTLAGKSNN